MIMECPGCKQSFEVSDDANEAACTNRNCYRPFRFRIFSEVKPEEGKDPAASTFYASLSVATPLKFLGEVKAATSSRYFVRYFDEEKAEELKKRSSLEVAAHNLSLPVQSLIADSANLLQAIPEGDANFEDIQHLFFEVQSLQLVVENLLHGAEEETAQPKSQWVTTFLLGVLSKGCQMFMGEAAEKGCDIKPIINVGGQEISMQPKDLAKEFPFYLCALYRPLLERHGVPRQSNVTEDSIRTAIVRNGKEDEVRPENLPQSCREIVRSMPGYDDADCYAKVAVAGQEIRADIRRIALHCMAMEMDVTQLDLAFRNLLHNAVKYSYRSVPHGKKRYVEVRCKRQNDCFQLSFQDYGIGITPQELEEGLIWLPRYRGTLSRDRNRTGAGLGLAHASKAIKRIHGGSIGCQSVQVAGGAYLTTFTVRLPIWQ